MKFPSQDAYKQTNRADTQAQEESYKNIMLLVAIALSLCDSSTDKSPRQSIQTLYIV